MDVTLSYAVRIESPKQEYLLRYLARSLASAARQDTPCKIIVVDYGSSRSYSRQIRALASFHRADQFVRVDASEWSRGRALNLAVRRCDTAYFAAMDADCLMDPGYITHVLGLSGERRFVMSCVRRVEGERRTYSDAMAAPAKAVHPGEGHGLICVPHAWLMKVRGYDEAYRIWGREDSDLLERARMDGMVVRQTDDTSVPQHLPHLSQKAWLDPKVVAAAKVANEKRYQETMRLRRVVAPQGQWGCG